MKIRLYSSAKLASGVNYEPSRAHGNYLANVLRRKTGDEVFLFNEFDGEFAAKFISKSEVEIGVQTIAPFVQPNITLLFAPVKFGKIDYLAQKATELGVSCLQPVHTKFTQIERINYDRLRANCIEAAEQTGRISVPQVNEVVKLAKLFENWDTKTKIIFCDDSLQAKPISAALAGLPKSDYAILIGPEGGFAEEETALLKSKNYVIPVTMGKRLLRAETAALAALAVFQSILGDWND